MVHENGPRNYAKKARKDWVFFRAFFMDDYFVLFRVI